ncbi:hypothetical protein [Kandleria vitulina]|uniref:hypothetical protein n=1 Tax=Kandleria vitulina TaxID=1630 RepID=UPI00049105DF|nr:hypothetical protein [Kandleria vitulina]
MCADILDRQLEFFESYNQESKNTLFEIFETEAKKIFYLENEKLSECSKILGGINECDFVLPKLICFDQVICEYEYGKASSNNNNNDTTFLADERIKKSRDDLYKFNKNYNNIVIILESPHVDEFRYIIGCKDGFRIGMPCMGKTGENLKKYFIDELDKCLEEVFNNDKFKDILKDDKNKKFNIIVMNAIQFQCSLGFKPSKEKNELCKKLFKDEVNDKDDKSEKNIIKGNMIERLSEYKPKFILNCSTYIIRKKIEKIVIDYSENIDEDGKSRSIIYIEGNHPSSWENENYEKLKKETLKLYPEEK